MDGDQPNRASYCGKLISGVEREEGGADPADPAVAPLSLRAKMLMSAYLPECRADGMADVRDLKSRGDFPRVGSTPTPGTTALKKNGTLAGPASLDSSIYSVSLFAADRSGLVDNAQRHTKIILHDASEAAHNVICRCAQRQMSRNIPLHTAAGSTGKNVSGRGGH